MNGASSSLSASPRDRAASARPAEQLIAFEVSSHSPGQPVPTVVWHAALPRPSQRPWAAGVTSRAAVDAQLAVEAERAIERAMKEELAKEGRQRVLNEMFAREAPAPSEYSFSYSRQPTRARPDSEKELTPTEANDLASSWLNGVKTRQGLTLTWETTKGKATRFNVVQLPDDRTVMSFPVHLLTEDNIQCAFTRAVTWRDNWVDKASKQAIANLKACLPPPSHPLDPAGVQRFSKVLLRLTRELNRDAYCEEELSDQHRSSSLAHFGIEWRRNTDSSTDTAGNQGGFMVWLPPLPPWLGHGVLCPRRPTLWSIRLALQEAVMSRNRLADTLGWGGRLSDDGLFTQVEKGKDGRPSPDPGDGEDTAARGQTKAANAREESARLAALLSKPTAPLARDDVPLVAQLLIELVNHKIRTLCNHPDLPSPPSDAFLKSRVSLLGISWHTRWHLASFGYFSVDVPDHSSASSPTNASFHGGLFVPADATVASLRSALSDALSGRHFVGNLFDIPDPLVKPGLHDLAASAEGLKEGAAAEDDLVMQEALPAANDGLAQLGGFDDQRDNDDTSGPPPEQLTTEALSCLAKLACSDVLARLDASIQWDGDTSSFLLRFPIAHLTHGGGQQGSSSLRTAYSDYYASRHFAVKPRADLRHVRGALCQVVSFVWDSFATLETVAFPPVLFHDQSAAADEEPMGNVEEQFIDEGGDNGSVEMPDSSPAAVPPVAASSSGVIDLTAAEQGNEAQPPAKLADNDPSKPPRKRERCTTVANRLLANFPYLHVLTQMHIHLVWRGAERGFALLPQEACILPFDVKENLERSFVPHGLDEAGLQRTLADVLEHIKQVLSEGSSLPPAPSTDENSLLSVYSLTSAATALLKRVKEENTVQVRAAKKMGVPVDLGIGWADGEGGRPGFEVHVREVTPGAASDAMHDGGFYRPVRMTVAALKAALRSAVAARNELVKLFNMPTEIHTASIEGFNPLDPSPAAADKEDWSSAASAADGVPPARQSRAPNRQNRGVKASTGTKRKASPSKSSAPKAHRRGKKGRFVSTAASGGSQRASNGESDAKAALSRFQACPITVSDSTNLAAMAAEVLEACKQHGCYPAEGPEIFWEECKVGYAIRFPSNDGTGTFRRRYFKPPQPVNVCALKMAIMAALTFHRKLVSEEGRACCSGEGQGGGHGAGECASRAMHVDVSKGVQEDGDVFALLPRDEINRLALNFQHRIQQEDSNMRRSTSSSTLASGATIRVTWNGADETFDVHLIAPHAPEQLLEKLKLSRKNVSQMRALVGRAVEARNAHADKYHCQPSKISIEAVLS